MRPSSLARSAPIVARMALASCLSTASAAVLAFRMPAGRAVRDTPSGSRYPSRAVMPSAESTAVQPS